MHRAAPAIACLLVALTALAPHPAAAGSPAPSGSAPHIEADLDGTPIASMEVERH